MVKLFQIIISFLIHLSSIYSQRCQNDMTISIDTNCFNEIIFFNNKNYRAGHFSLNNKGDMVVEYSDDRSRLFYGFKKNGRHFFDTEDNIKEIEYIENPTQPDAYARYESNNIFVYLEDDINKEKSYLFSTSSYITATELHDLENNNYTITTAKTFFGFQIYGFVFSLLEAKINNANMYFCIFNHGPKDDENNGESFSVKKFGFKSFNFDNTYINDIKTEYYNRYNRIVNGFIMEEDEIIVVFYMNKTKWYNFNYYDFNLQLLAEKIVVGTEIEDTFYDGLFFKGFYLYKRYSAIIYFLKHEDGKGLHLEILDMNLSKDNYGYNSILKENINEYYFSTYISMSDFLKINNERLVYISTTNYKNLYILFFDLYKTYTIMKTRVYFLNFHVFELQKELTGCIFNNFIAFTGTAYYTNSPGLFSTFILFGFPKGNDKIIDLSPYFINLESFNPKINLIKFLLEDFTIDNNLFNYEKVDKIILGTIPEHIIFYNNINNIPLSEGDLIDEDYRLIYNKETVKENKYYELSYQFIVKEQNYSDFYKYEVDKLSYYDKNSDVESEFTPLIYYGRTNLLKFKLCNGLCETCKMYGVSINDQQCLTCSSEYDYNYFLTKPFNCLPKGYLHDVENEIIIECNKTNSKFYFDVERNKTICFKYDYNCPYGYSDFNPINNECIQTLIFNTIIYDYKDSNFTNDYILSSLVPSLIENYNGKSNVIETKDNFTFQITTSENEMSSMKSITDNKCKLSIIDFLDCEKTLRDTYDIDDNIPLIILKSEKVSSIISEKSLQYEVYNSLTKEKLDLSICENNINVLYPLTLDENGQNLLEDMNEQGYDMFDFDGIFYQDICTPYKSENNTDVLLYDRINDFYDNSYTCPSNCNYSFYTNKSDYLCCECSIENKNISLDYIGNLMINSFKNVFHTLNYKFIKCYKLVFHVNVITKNIGSIFCIVLFVIYLVIFILYLIKGISPLKKEVDNYVKKHSKSVKFKDNKNDDNMSCYSMNESNKTMKFNKNKKKLNNSNIEHIINRTPSPLTMIRTNKTKKNKILKKEKDKKKDNKKKFIELDTKSEIVSSKKRKNKDKEKEKEKDLDTKSAKTEILTTTKNKNKDKNNRNKDDDIKSAKSEVISESKVRNSIRRGKLSDFELSNLNYEDALKSDKRNLNQIYFAKLKKKHLILFTFFADKDFNLIYIKIAKFVFEVCTNLAMNVLFFFDESMHKIYLNYGKFDFVQQIPQILCSSIISSILNLFIGYLVLTEKQIHKVIYLKQSDSDDKLNEINNILKFIKIRYIIFFGLTILLFIFYWYFISSFCAVYGNTQIIFLEDFISSFVTGLIYPFIIYYLLAACRVLSLKDKKKKRLKFLYFIGNL